jgi:hypothetical protein
MYPELLLLGKVFRFPYATLQLVNVANKLDMPKRILCRRSSSHSMFSVGLTGMKFCIALSVGWRVEFVCGLVCILGLGVRPRELPCVHS